MRETEEGSKEELEKNLKTIQGITLIALVITIIVLLILAGVTISTLTGDNGILTKATTSKEQTEVGQIKDRAKVDILGVKAENNGEITLKQLKEVLKKYFNDGEVNALTDDTIETAELTTIDGKYKIKVSDLIDKVSNVPLDWDAILADATADPGKYKHPDQSSTNGDIGIGTDGEPVNLDLWKYSVRGNYVELSSEEASSGVSSYDNSNIVNGKIKGTVPQYIKKDGEDVFVPVTGMGWTFYGCTSLTIAPEIPSSVTGLVDTFSGCTKLTVAPTIPSSVDYMKCSFQGCTGLTTAPEIPSMVKNMEWTFYGCTNLTGELVINATNLSSYSECLKNASTATGTDLKLSGSCSKLNEILLTKSSNSNISLKQ